MWNSKDCFSETFSYGVEKYTFTDADASDLTVNERSDDDEEEIGCAPTANFSVRYRKSLTVGVKKKKTIPLCDVAHELTSRTYGEKKWCVVVGDCEGSVGIQSEGDLLY